MANKDDYLTDYRCFFENFAQTYNPHDQLPVKLGSYKLASFEVVGGIIDWTTQYLNQKKCPQSLLSPLVKIIIDEVRGLCRKQTIACGFSPSLNAYDPLKLMQCVVTKTNEVCLRYLDNSKLCSLPTPGPPYTTVSVCAIKNSRRRMEDRHVVIHDLNSLFIDDEVSPSSYYAIFDGHAGHDAAAYSCAHLHQFLGESKYFISNPEQALREAFLKTDTLFNDKCNLENFRSGTTALCVLLKHKEKTLYIGWVGDSQAVLVSQGQCIQCVHPHKPCREDEKNRIEQEGGTVIYWGTWRVNGQLAVSRAIGDVEYKPYVTAVPDIIEIPLSGVEDFLILGCDGLWDVMSEKDAARLVYEEIIRQPDDIESVSQRLVQLAKEKGSCDNISVIVVFLREPSKVAAEAHWATRHNIIMDTLDNANATNPFANSNSGDLKQKEEYVIGESYKKNGSDSLDFLLATNGKRTSHEFDEDDDLGPETAVDTIDDVLLTTTVISAKNLMEEIVNNNSALCEKEKATLETDSDILNKQSADDFENDQFMREETPTPPAELVQDTSGLVDNVGESGDESEDEWNYIKGDQAEKENIKPPSQDKEICELTSDLDTDDNMSQLNPNAAEFVPISPKRTPASPSYDKITDDDLVITESPKVEPNNEYDINVPNLQEFETEIKSRPSDVHERVGDDTSDNASLTTQEIMENLLNGKSIDEIEFQPNSTPVKFTNSGEFHFGPNSTPFATPGGFMDQSEVLSTRAVIGDNSNYMEDTQLDNFTNLNESHVSAKEEDPMSMSFYQDKQDEDNNPFDLNKVQVLPDNIDDFLEKCKEDERKEEENPLMDTTISDLPEHNPLEPEAPKSPVSQQIERELSPSPLASPKLAEILLLSEEPIIQSEFGINCRLAQALVTDEHDELGVEYSSSPIPNVQPEFNPSPRPSPALEDFSLEQNTTITPEASPRTQSPMVDIDERLKSSVVDENEQRLQSPLLDVDESSPITDLVEIAQESRPSLTTQSPVPDLLPITKHEEREESSPLPEPEKNDFEDELIPHALSPELIREEELVAKPVPSPRPPADLPSSPSPQSPRPPADLPSSPSPQSPRPPADLPLSPSPQSPRPPAALPLSPTLQSPISPQQSPSPIPIAQSPIRTDSPADDITSSVKDSPLPVASPTDKPLCDSLLCPTILDDPFVHHETESVTTTDVNSFLERSLVPDIASPLSGDDGLFNTSNEYVTENVEIKSEVIVPEFPIQTVTTPSEESKTEEANDEIKIVAAATAVTVVAATMAAVVEKKSTITKPKTAPATKKPASKPSTAPTTKPISKAPPATAKPASLKSTTSTAPKVRMYTTTASKVSSSTTSKTTPKDKKPIAAKTAEKKPLVNGDAAKPLVKRAAPSTTAASKPAARTVPAKPSPTKTGFESKPSRPTTAPVSATRTITKMTSTARTPPTTGAAKTTAAKSTSSTTPKATTAAVPKPKPTTLAPRPKPLAPDTKKQIKETTNKQITSSTKPLLSSRTKSPGVGSTVTKTASGKVDPKKPIELIRPSAAKPKTTGIVKKTKTVTNGVATKITTTKTITETTLIKDVSPVIENNIIDNSQVLEINNVAD